MYEKLISEFRNSLNDIRLDKIILVSFGILFFSYLVLFITFWIIYKHWSVTVVSVAIFLFSSAVIAYSIIFNEARKNNNLSFKDYFHCKRVFKSLKNLFRKDIEILVPIIKSCGINTRAKVLEAIRHYQILLLRKSNKGFAIISVVSLTVSVAGIILASVKYQSSEELFVLMLLLVSLMIVVILLCILVKKMYIIFYGLTEYALYERIESALSEIWMKNLIK